MKKLFVLGHARHGKDTFADMIAERVPNLKTVSSSAFVGGQAVFPTLRDRYGYKTFTECFDDRFNHRKEWHELISAYNECDPSRLARELFNVADIYVGLRCIVELEHARDLAALTVWVDRSNFLPPESADSNTITANDCDLVIPNNSTLDDLAARADRFVAAFYEKRN